SSKGRTRTEVGAGCASPIRFDIALGRMADATRASALQWFVRGGSLTVSGRPPVRVNVDPILVGRDPSCHVVVDDPEVSSIHCELRAEGQGVLLKDLGSR